MFGKIEIPKRKNDFLKILLRKNIEIITEWHRNQYITTLQNTYSLLVAEKITDKLLESHQRLKDLQERLNNLDRFGFDFLNDDGAIKVYAVNYNFLRVTAGMSGALYA